jgi:cytochrome c oxidase subunit 4
MTAGSHLRLGAVFVALLVLLGATIAVAKFDLGLWNFPIAASIATAKTLLIATWFMELRESPSLTRLAAAAGIVWLLILMSLALADYWTRASLS